MEFQQILNQLSFSEIFEPVPKNPKKDKNINICEGCKVELKLVDCFMVCPDCGETDLDAVFYDIPFELNNMKKSFYKRRLYCIEKLNYLNGLKCPTSARYNDMVTFLRKKKFVSILKLKRMMKKYGYSKYYKYIYNVYYQIKKIRLIQLTARQIQKISLDFVKLDINFVKNMEFHKRKNFIAYNSIIYLILKENKTKGYSKVIKPHNHIALTDNVYKKYLCN
jgi:hypothetical protein